ncbi:MAG TPA: homoserine kinase [Actinomycetota bacterium]|nr:homoserine kinase [Actinomycetota bacterium]
MRLTAIVPATSANLGPGFDSFGIALDLCNEVTVDTDAGPGVSWEGEGADELPADGSDLVSLAIAFTVERQARLHPGATVPSFALHGLNRIPLERGLGSSSAAAVAGTALASALLGPAGLGDAPRYATFAHAAELEGHPDNAAPATYGGLTVVADGHVRRIEVSPDIRPVVLLPETRVVTETARRALPENVRLRDAVYNVAHGALVVHALSTGDLDLLRVALQDRLHQDVRLALVPEVRERFEALRRSFPVCVSGAGPSLLAFEAEPGAVPDPGHGWRVLRIPVRSSGVEVRED